MSRSHYSEDGTTWDFIRWRGAVSQAIRSKRGQFLLKELLDALDEMPVKKLARNALVTADGEYCALGVLGKKRGLPLEMIDPEDPEAVAKAFAVAPALVKEIAFENDDDFFYCNLSPQGRWNYMRQWVERHICPE